MMDGSLLPTIRTTCPYCGVGCGVLASRDGPVRGDPAHPANQGRLCSKGAALGETTGLDGRLLHPMVRGKRASWDAALDATAEAFRAALVEYGPEGVALYVSGQLLTEDYYAANKFTKGFLGTGNIDSNSRLCMASAVAGHRRAFGEDLVPGTYEDLELADLVILVGSNLAWCHPVLHQRILAAKALRPMMRIIVVDPRRTASCEAADLHLALRPGSDVALFAGLLTHLAQSGFAVPDAMRQVLDVPALTGLDPAQLAQFNAWFSGTERVVTLWSQGTNQSSSGTDKANAIINCHLATNRIGRPGMGPFSVTGQPNAMGGREVGALSNMLAGHLDAENPAEVAALRDFWQAPSLATKPGLKAVDLFRAAEAGRIGAMWVMATNPAVSLPDSAMVRRALQRIPSLILSDCHAGTDTAEHAQILLPALGWGEKDGTVTNSERVISRQRGFLPAPGEAKPDWWIVAQVAQRLGWGAQFAWPNAAAIFREHAAVTELARDRPDALSSGRESPAQTELARDRPDALSSGRESPAPEARPAQRVFDLGGLSDLTDAAYATLPPTQWPVPRHGQRGGRITPPVRRLVPTPFRLPEHGGGMILMTGRLRDQWHTMTRTGRVPRLMSHAPEPVLSVNPADAAALTEGALVRVASAWGEAVLRLALDPATPRGTCFAPMHWTDQLAPRARINTAVTPATDPISGQPELKHTPVTLTPFVARWHGFLLARKPLGARLGDWCAMAPAAHGAFRHEIAGSEAAAFDTLVAALGEGAPGLVLHADATGEHRAAWLRDGQLIAALFIGPDHLLPPREWLLSLFGEARIGSAARHALLAGMLPDGPPPSPTLCACHGVNAASIRAAIVAGARDVAAIGTATSAGTGCGSCKPELAAMLALEPA
ncbi:molybdopterin-dependent oxidoreductase [Sediminicoccus sp. KRV36]|uniref:nitrate reductase n=1 Tax=Sediminicoccus sp. KRV36 TaxID=3133721 RepID=UPI00200EBFA0|nr:molybdopterin-dependent oxidoreductase [Sediminicoccus rosea]UPY36250.1 molybdopterin-dependent oxidoreductase [Sediminicoccus rosea]